jgi:hypothetical protein
MAAFEQAIADVFGSLETWLVSAGATASMLRLAWAVLTFLWLAHVAIAMRPGEGPDFVAVFGRLAVASGLLLGVGRLNQVILLVFQTLRDAGGGVLYGLIGQSWSQFVQQLGPIVGSIWRIYNPWFTYPWAVVLLLLGLLFGVLLLGVSLAVYLAILFFAHLTLLLGLFLSPLAVALLAAPGTARWTLRWAAVITRTALLVFTVRVIHAAALYLAIVFPVRRLANGLATGEGLPGAPTLNYQALVSLGILLLLETVGTVIGAYAMIRAERLTGQFVDGVAFAEGIFAGPFWLGTRAASRERRSGGGEDAAGRLPPGQVSEGSGSENEGGEGGAQTATIIERRPSV